MFIFFLLGKAIKKQTKRIEDQRNKKVEVLKILKPATKINISWHHISQEQRNNKIKKEINRIKTV